MSIPSVVSWVKRYKNEGIRDLDTHSGRGRKPIIDCTGEEGIRKAIEEDCQCVSKGKVAW